MKKERGFTLIELVVVIAIVAILATIAIPSYMDQIRRSRRNAAEASIQQIALLEERFRADNPAYTTTWASLGGNPNSPDSRGTYYTFTLTAPTGPPPTYTITATAKGDQVNDKSNGVSCTPLTYVFDTTGNITKGPDIVCWGR